VIGEFAARFAAAWSSTSGIEIAAVVLGVAYLLLAIPQHILCWAAALASSLAYVIVLYRARLYMESTLNVFYAGMAVYGYWQWRSGARGVSLPVCRWRWPRHLLGLGAAVLLSIGTSHFLRAYTSAAWPFVDSMVTWSSTFATFLVAKKVYENWYWWLAIDSIAAYLYFTRHLVLTMLLFLAYLVLIGFGMREWRRSWLRSHV
jgi:nicotinamide mononucleotide transporter